MSFSVSASPRILTKGDTVTITGSVSGGSDEGSCTTVGYEEDSAKGSSASFTTKKVGTFHPYGEFTTPLGGYEKVTGSYFEVQEPS